MHTFLWHDYETFGANPRRDRPAQFAAIRTDADLNEIGEPLVLYCKPTPDTLPEPQACLITGITPQECLEKGLPEYRFAAEIERAFSQPNTIGVGYNSIRFDDEVTRFLFWRNLIDPYAREWQNNCGRWDVLDVARAAYALRPDGIVWPKNGDGRISFRLEDLAKANGLQHDAAHDALSDVRATLDLARLIRQKQPRLFDFCFGLRQKDRVADEIGLQMDPAKRQPFLHISGMYSPERGCMALMLPLAQHPTNKNEIIAWDLSDDPSQLLSLDAETIRARMFTKADDLPEGVDRLPIKTIHLNRSPIVIKDLRTLSPDMAKKWGIDMESAFHHARQATDSTALTQKMTRVWREVYRQAQEDDVDVDEDLYGGFVGNADRRQLNRARALSPQGLATTRFSFEDGRLDELLLRYRARNFPETLAAEEMKTWREHCAQRLTHYESWRQEVTRLRETADARGQAVLDALREYGKGVRQFSGVCV
ncbi:MAG: exodeoxyribonuclease I [Oxalobacter sp.]|nr:MAG: exodeoxyribonuclease I [Oxalobacter sp.]